MASFRGGMGGGMNNLVKQAQKIQEQMQEAEKELEELEVVGLSGGGEEGDETGRNLYERQKGDKRR